MKPKEGKRALTLKLVVLLAVFTAVVGASLYIFWPSESEASGPVALKEFESKALSEAKTLIPEAESMVGLEGSSSETDIYSNTYSLEDKDGNSIGAISADPMTGEIVCFYDAREPGPSADVLISMDQARAIVERFLLEEKGIDVKEGPIQIITEELKEDGIEGPPDNPTTTYSYTFRFGEEVNGLPIGDSTNGSVSVSVKDGRIFGFNVRRSISTNSSKDVGTVKLTEDEAIALAIKAMQEKLQLFTKPFVPEESAFLGYDDFGDGRMTPYVTTVLLFGDQDLEDPIGAKYQIQVFVSLETGEILKSFGI